MRNQIVDPIEPTRVAAAVSRGQKRAAVSFDWFWMAQSVCYLGLVAGAFYLDQQSNGRLAWRYGAALPALLWLLALTAKIGTIEGKIDRLLEIAETTDKKP